MTLSSTSRYYGYMAHLRGFFSVGKNEGGQILLIVVLTTIVALTVGLSVASRTITNLKISKENEESQRAFQAAEAGVEKAVKQLGNNTTLSDQQLSNNSSFNTSISVEQSPAFLLNNGDVVTQDVGHDVWLSNYPDYASPISGSVTIRWGNGQNSCNGTGTQVIPAIEVILLTGNTTNPSVSKHVFDTCSGRTSGSETTGGSGTIEGINFSNSAVINDANPKLIMKIIPLYNSAIIGIEGANVPQGNIIESVGSAGETKRKIVYFESYPQLPPEIFPYVLISQ